MKRFQDVCPELQPILAAAPAWDPDIPLPYPHWAPSPEVRREAVMIPAPDGARPGKVYRPAKYPEKEVLPAMLWIHGGGYVAGDIDCDDPLCEQFALGADCCVVTVDYRLAPEFPYPAGLRDSYAALRWMADNAPELHIDPARIAVAGASAGGGMAAALSLLARDKGGPALCFQMPLYPMLDDRSCTPSSHEILPENFPGAWNRKNSLYAWSAYLKGIHADGADVPAYAAPTRAKDLHALPPAFLCIGTLDLFRDETLAYVARLAQADVPVEFHLYPGCYHGFESVYSDTGIGRRCREEYIAAMRRALRP